MEGYRSESSSDGRLQIESYNGKGQTSMGINGMQDLRSYSASSAHANKTHEGKIDGKLKKGKSGNGSSSKSWSLDDPELQRKKRVASYKAYGVEAKIKGSLSKSFRWFKDRCSRAVNGL